MALFRVLARLLHSSPRLSECSRTGATSFFLVHLEKRALRDVSKLPRSAARLSTEAKEKRPKVTRNNQEHGSVLNELMSVKEPQPTQLTVGAKGNENLPPLVKLSFSLAYAVVQAGKDFTYLLVVLGGFAVAGFLLWSVGSEFFSSNSPQTVYSKALKRVRLDPQVGLGLYHMTTCCDFVLILILYGGGRRTRRANIRSWRAEWQRQKERTTVRQYG